MARQAGAGGVAAGEGPAQLFRAGGDHQRDASGRLAHRAHARKQAANQQDRDPGGRRHCVPERQGSVDPKIRAHGSKDQMKVYDVSIKLAGLAPTDVQVAEFIRKLNESKLLKDVNLVITDQYDREGEQLRKFQVECMLDPNAEVQLGENNKTVAVELQQSK